MTVHDKRFGVKINAGSEKRGNPSTDGNKNIIASQKTLFGDFHYDEATLLLVDG